MDHIGLDLHKRESQICLLAEGGELIERRIPYRTPAFRRGTRRASAGPGPAGILDGERIRGCKGLGYLASPSIGTHSQSLSA